jgi:putative serine protease PepD
MPSTPPSLWTDRPDDWASAPEPVEADTNGPRTATAARRRGPARARLAAGAAVLALATVGAYELGTDHGNSGAPSTLAAAPAAAISPTPKTDIGAVYAKDSAAVVSVRVGNGSGSGFVIDKQGTIVTNDHVVGNAQSAQVRFNDSDGLVSAKVVGADPSSDLAVLRVNPSDLPQGLTPLTFAQSKDVSVGDSAIAIGYPLGLERTATAGIISGLGREIQAPNGYRIDRVLQTDAPINPGNSGGPLLDAQGRVMGVNSQIATAGGSSGNVGIGFAIPSDTVRQVVPKLLKGESIKRPFLGVSTAPSPQGRGAEIAQVTNQSPAARAGLQTGDVITQIDGKPVSGPQGVVDAVANHAPGDAITVGVSRGGQTASLKLKLAVRPQSSP